ncbi:outer membrane protein assembly factor BamB [Thiohalobacter sp. IOR34]|uniref:outer membrane protein assembly factor BamB n=1 Tax=Thiohalobacter sp. IOR34 TaxID=3057176 RepID=UPI0025B03E97|nr:outer membrane protein assembly factor BamB [Thiohalobacter sp. IOR34]WJW76268.1 outer membrane protein assembly factor BamB [Thiohalobacter sp. IOR34]
MILRLLLGMVLLGLAGCSWLPGSEEDNAEPPAELQPITASEVTLRPLWKRDLGDGTGGQFIRLRPALDGGRLFAADNKGRVVAFEAESGAPLWSVETGIAVSGGVGVGEGLVLVGGDEAEVVALDWRDGSEVWRSTVSSEVLGAPAAAGGVVVVQSVDGNLTGLDAASGERLWVFDRTVPVLSLRGTSSPVLVEGYAITGFASGKLVALELKRGLPLWETAVAVPRGRSELDRMVDIDSPPVVRGGLIYSVTYQGRVAAVQGGNGRLIWARDMSSFAGLAVDFRQLYVSDASSDIWALDRRNGAALWRQDALHNRMITAPVVAGDQLAVGDFEGYLHLLSRSSGEIQARVRVDDAGILAPPVVDGDRLYVFGNGGTLAAYRVEPR